MRCINRAVVLVKPRQPFVDWVNAVAFGEDDTPESLEELRKDANAYLFDEMNDIEDLEEDLKENWLAIFTNEVSDWDEDESKWPELTYKNFRIWFDFNVGTEVIDLAEEELFYEEV